MPEGERVWLRLATIAVAVLAIVGLGVVVVAGAAIYTWGWRGRGSAAEQRLAAVDVDAFVGTRCRDRPCVASGLTRVAPRLWRVRITGLVSECVQIDLDRFVVRSTFVQGASPVPCVPVPLRHAWMSVGVLAESPPYLQGAVANPTGLEAGVVSELARRLHVDDVRWSRVRSGESLEKAVRTYDFVLGALAVPRTAPRVSFSKPFTPLSQALLARKRNATRVIKDFPSGSLRLGVNRVGFRPQKGHLRSFRSNESAISEVLSGRLDGYVIDVAAASYAVEKRPKSLKIVGVFSTGYGLAMGLQTGNPLLESLNAQLTAMRADGTLRSLQEQWLPGTTKAARLG
jgi:ABC-type amino acid transport substrate-binding protein